MRSRPPRAEKGRGNKEEKEWKRVTGGFPRATSAGGAHVIHVTAARRSSMTPRESGRSPNDATGRLLGAARVERSQRPSRVESKPDHVCDRAPRGSPRLFVCGSRTDRATDFYYVGESPRFYIVGDVLRPRTAREVKHLTVHDALATVSQAPRTTS